MASRMLRLSAIIIIANVVGVVNLWALAACSVFDSNFLIIYVVIITRAQYAPGLCVCVRLYLPVRSMRQGYAFVSVYMCVCVFVCLCVVKKTRLFASYSSKISTKTLSTASSLNL